jgi:hypothetical protein
VNLPAEIEAHIMRDTFRGYDWGTPVTLWTIRPTRVIFTLEQLAIADRALECAA